mgnify:CR=1 FL=1
MIDFEKKIMSSQLDSPNETNADDFLKSLHNRVSESKDNRRTLITSLCMLMVLSLMTFTQFGAPSIQTEFYNDEDIETFFGTDFWTINSDSLDHVESYTYDVAYFLLQEGYLWDTIELLDELEIEEEIAL